MKYLLVACLLLSACTSVPVKRHFPDVPAVLTEPCPQLQTINGANVSIIDLIIAVTENYTTYYECAAKVEGWNEWYKKQRQIFEEVK